MSWESKEIQEQESLRYFHYLGKSRIVTKATLTFKVNLFIIDHNIPLNNDHRLSVGR